MNEDGRRFVQRVIASYNDTPFWTSAGGWLVGALLTSNPFGLLAGAVVGHALSRKVAAPKGMAHTCDQCFVSYEVHIPGSKGEFRCPGCNKLWIIT